MLAGPSAPGVSFGLSQFHGFKSNIRHCLPYLGKEWNMRRSALAAALTLIFVTTAGLEAQNAPDNSASWSGVLISSACNIDEAFAESAKCTAEAPGATLALYDDTIRQIYTLEPQSQVTGHLGDSVTVRGTLENGTIHSSSIARATSTKPLPSRRSARPRPPAQHWRCMTIRSARSTHSSRKVR